MKRIILSVTTVFACIATANAQTKQIEQQNIKPITSAVSTIQKITPVTFNYNDALAKKLNLKTENNGFDMAQLRAIAPELVIDQQLNYNQGKNNNKTIVVPKTNNEAIIALLVAGIKQQQKEIDELKKAVQSLNAKVKPFSY